MFETESVVGGQNSVSELLTLCYIADNVIYSLVVRIILIDGIFEIGRESIASIWLIWIIIVPVIAIAKAGAVIIIVTIVVACITGIAGSAATVVGLPVFPPVS